MLKPSADELSHALRAATYMRERTQDKHHVAKSLLYLHERNKKLEAVLTAVERFLRFGQGSTEHATLVRAINAANRSEERDSAALTPHY